MVLEHLPLAKTSAQGQAQIWDIGILYNLETQNPADGNSNTAYSREVCESGREDETKM